MFLLEQKNKKGNLAAIHFIGIGGIGISGMAEILHNLGYKVQGSDLSQNNNTKRLAAKGIKTFVGHDAANIKGAAYIVVSTAIKDDNPEVRQAIKQQIPVIRRAEMLAELMRLKCSVAISGSHGKTTTTSLVACLFEAAKLAPTVINGGIINNRSTNAYVGSGDYLIAEADESDATFIKIPATVAVITNIDPEHIDFYKSFDNLITAFKSFITNLPFYGFGVVCIDHKVVRNLTKEITDRKIITYGIDSEDAHIKAFNIKSDISSSTFDVKVKLPNASNIVLIEQITIPTPGKHNVLNALAAIAIGIELDFGLETITGGFKEFQGVKRRFTRIGQYNKAEIIDDYAHHPVEIKATLATARSIANKRGSKVIAIFQPHRYSRLENLFYDFAASFSDADKAYITDVFAAGEKPIENITGQNLVKEINNNGKQAKFITGENEIRQIVESDAKHGDIFVMMGAGSITNWTSNVIQKLSDSSSVDHSLG